MEERMLKKSLVFTGAILFATSAFAQSPTTKSAPGQQMQKAQDTGQPSTAPGASEYAPGKKMQAAKKSGKKTGPGASDFAPGQQSTTGSAGAKK